MSSLTAKDVESVVGPQLGVTGPVAGFGIQYEIAGDTKVSSPTVGVELKLNEKSLAHAEKMSGVTRTPKTGTPSMAPSSPAAQRQEKSDNMYAKMFDKKGLSPSVSKGMSPRVGFGSRPDYRAAFGINPLMRVKQRRLLELRKTFDQIAAKKKKSVAVNLESLPQEAIRKIVLDALARGDRMTPLGSLARAMKLAGMKPKVMGPKKRQWALFCNPEMVPSGWATD
jgi:hypothetical protein